MFVTIKNINHLNYFVLPIASTTPDFNCKFGKKILLGFRSKSNLNPKFLQNKQEVA